MRLTIKEIENELGGPRPVREWGREFIATIRSAAMPQQAATADLTWYFQHAVAAMGLKAMPLDPGCNFSTEDDPNAEESVLGVVGRERPIRRAVEALPWREQEVLAAHFGDRRPFRPYADLGPAATVVHLTAIARALTVPIEDAIKKSSTKEALKTAAEKLLSMCCEHYVEVRLAQKQVRAA